MPSMFRYFKKQPWLYAFIPAPVVYPHFVSGADLVNPSADFFYIANIHPLEGVDVPLWVYELHLLKWQTIGHN